MMKIEKFNSDQEALDAGFSIPLGNGEYTKPYKPESSFDYYEKRMFPFATSRHTTTD